MRRYEQQHTERTGNLTGLVKPFGTAVVQKQSSDEADSARLKKLINRAMRKYGWEAFRDEILRDDMKVDSGTKEAIPSVEGLKRILLSRSGIPEELRNGIEDTLVRICPPHGTPIQQAPDTIYEEPDCN